MSEFKKGDIVEIIDYGFNYPKVSLGKIGLDVRLFFGKRSHEYVQEPNKFLVIGTYMMLVACEFLEGQYKGNYVTVDAYGLRLLSDNTEEKEEPSSRDRAAQHLATYGIAIVKNGKAVGPESYRVDHDSRPLSIQEQAFKDKQDAIISENQKLIDANREHRERQSTIIAGLVELPDIPKNGRW
jgi:hypothetical protein